MMTAADHAELHRRYVALAGSIRALAYQSGLVEDLASVALDVLAIADFHHQMSHLLAEKEREMKVKKMRRFVLLFIVIVALLGAVSFVSAQDATDEPLPTVVLGTAIPERTPEPAAEPVGENLSDVVVPVERTAEGLLNVIWGALGAFITAPFTLFVVSLLKRWRILDEVSSKTLAFVVAGILVIATWIARYFGFEVQLDSFYKTATIVGPVIMQFVLTLLRSSEQYSQALMDNTAIVSYQRPDQPSSLKSFVRTPPPGEHGQGLVEYALILVLVAVVVIVVLALLGPAIGNVFSQIVNAIDPNAMAAPSG